MPILPNKDNAIYQPPSQPKTRKSTLKQMAYARGIFNAEKVTKKDIALAAGFSRSVADHPAETIESKIGFHNAMAQLAADSNNLALSVMEEFKGRGMGSFTNSELIRALSTIASAWSKFNDPLIKRVKNGDYEGNKQNQNKLRTVILQRIENQTINTEKEKVILPEEAATPVEYAPVEDELDF